MTTRAAWVLLALLMSEAALLLTQGGHERALQRRIYQTLWRWAPKPADYVPPDRFAP